VPVVRISYSCCVCNRSPETVLTDYNVVIRDLSPRAGGFTAVSDYPGERLNGQRGPP